MAPKPPQWLVVVCFLLSIAAMAGGVYFGGTGRTPLAMLGTILFVLFGGVAFDLARRRST